MNDLKIYEIPYAIEESLDLITVDEATGEIVGKEAFLQLCDKAVIKVANTARYIKRAEDNVKLASEHIKILQARIKTEEKRIEFLRTLTLTAMQSLEMQKISEPDIVMSIAKTPAKVEVFDINQVPQDYFKPPKILEPELDKTKIKDDLKNGGEIAGVKLVSGLRLAIK